MNLYLPFFKYAEKHIFGSFPTSFVNIEQFISRWAANKRFRISPISAFLCMLFNEGEGLVRNKRNSCWIRIKGHEKVTKEVKENNVLAVIQQQYTK